MTAITRSIRKASKSTERDARVVNTYSMQPRRSLSPSSPAAALTGPSYVTATNCTVVTQPSTNIVEARLKLMAAVSRAVQELVDRDGYSRERATAFLIRQIRREDDPPKDDDIFRLMSSWSSDSLNRDDATTILTLASALRRIRSETSVSALGAVDQLTIYFSCRMFSVRCHVEGSSTKQQQAPSGESSHTAQFSSSCSMAYGSPTAQAAERSKPVGAASSPKVLTAASGKSSGKPSASSKRKHLKGSTTALSGKNAANDDTLALDEDVSEKGTKRKSLKSFTLSNDEATPACLDADVAEKEARMSSETSDQEKNLITSTLDQRLTRKRAVDHLPPCNKRARGTPVSKEAS